MSHSEEAIFTHAMGLAASQRCNYLSEVCRGNSELQQRLEQLLFAHEQEGGFLDLACEEFEKNRGRQVKTGTTIGPYNLVEKLGEGGFGVVYAAEQQHPVQRKVAIKVIKPGMDSRAVIARFEGERQALAMMNHPNIARVFDGGTGEDGIQPYFVMELVEGVPITEFCDTHSLSIRQRLELFTSVCNAVHHAHQKGIIHRDIKPSNVMVAQHDDKPVVKVIDFGVAKALNHASSEKTELTLNGTLVGTPQYMSPEQAAMSKLDVDTRSDIYSLSVLLYELLTGKTPLDPEVLRGASYREIQRLICEADLPRPSTNLPANRDGRYAREIRGDLDWIIMKGLEKDRDRRYESAKELSADIQRTLNHEPVLAGPPSLLYAANKFARRHRVPLILAAAATAVFAVLLWGISNDRQNQIAAIEKDETQLGNAVADANAALIKAIAAPSSAKFWTEAELMSAQIESFIDKTTAGDAMISRAETFLGRYSQARQNRDFMFSLEELLVSHSTNSSVESLQAMEQGFRRILKHRGFDVESYTPDQFAARLKNDHAPIKLTDALELWLSTRMKLAETGNDTISAREIESWTEVMSSADPNPLRTAIRSTIFAVRDSDQATLDKAVNEGDLSKMCARKLSWLSQAYSQVGAAERSAEIRDFALAKFSNDLMLNFENATRLMSQQRTDEAIRYFMRCTSIRPGNAGVWRELSEALAANNEWPQAIKAIKVAISLAPDIAASHLQLSNCFLMAERHEEAIDAAEKALSLDDSQYVAWRMIGRGNMQLGRYPQATAAFKKHQLQAGEDELARVDAWIAECEKQSNQ